MFNDASMSKYLSFNALHSSTRHYGSVIKKYLGRKSLIHFSWKKTSNFLWIIIWRLFYFNGFTKNSWTVVLSCIVFKIFFCKNIFGTFNLKLWTKILVFSVFFYNNEWHFDAIFSNIFLFKVVENTVFIALSVKGLG